MERARISLIIPAFNEERHIGKTLHAVTRARAGHKHPSAIGVIVVDNRSVDDTERVARSCGAKVVHERERRIASVRNRGAEEARGKIAAFLDADSTVTPGIFGSVDSAMGSGKYIGGGTLIELDGRSPGLFFTRCTPVIPARWPCGIMCGLLFAEKETFDVLGGFDETLY